MTAPRKSTLSDRTLPALVISVLFSVFRITLKPTKPPMRTPHLATSLVLAGAALMGGHASSGPMEITLQNHDQLNLRWEPSGRSRRNKTSSINQRQIRKNRRRSHAAGSKRAFLR
jgi:hypothetical protein